jgi:hypothetical protein
VRVWDVVSGLPNGEALTGHSGGPPGATNPESLCAKLTSNMSREQWRAWVSPDIDYIPACPELPIPAEPVSEK